MTLIQWVTKGYAAMQQALAKMQAQIDSIQKTDTTAQDAKNKEFDAKIKALGDLIGDPSDLK